jgi:predicted ATPase/DNA-binding SARP family transcriptional activator
MDGRWRIELLGQLRWCQGDPAPSGGGIPLQRQKATALLAFLACHPQHPHPREVLIELLWPEADPEDGRRRLRSQLHILRELLAGSEGSLLIAGRSTVHLDPGAFTTDVAEFRAALQAAARAADLSERTRRLEAAVALYRGELLPGHYEAWVLTERQALAEQFLGALRELAAAREEAGDLEGALAAARQAVSSDPLEEEAHYNVMRLSAALGQTSAALRQYQELERLLREELDETPSAEARALAQELRDSARTLVVARRLQTADPPTPLPVPDPAPASAVVSPPPFTPSGREPAQPGTHGVGGSVITPSSGRLPVQLTRFFGREAEIARLTELLSSPVTRLVTITGPGGSGKTRLAIAAAGRLQELFGDAIAFVPLADLTDAARVPDAVAADLGLDRSPDRETAEQVIEHLSARPWLLVLDNYEHLVEEGALLVRRLLERVPLLRIVVTSRQRLGLSGEQEFALLPLPTPRRSTRLEQLQEYASVQLFVDRARAARADFHLTEANAAAVGELCDRLEGLPLAVELAAARAAVLSPEQMLAQLKQRFTFLVSRQRDVPARHRTMHAAIDSSYQLLAPEPRQFFARLSVFRGGWTLEAAAAVAGVGGWVLGLREPASDPTPDPQPPTPDTLDLLEQLRDYSLIGVEAHEGEVRYRLLETLREFGWEQLAASGELAAVRTRHRDWFLQLAAQSVAAAYGPEQTAWIARLEAEHDNLRAALAWCQEEADADPDGAAAAAGLRLADALSWFWLRRGYVADCLQWLEGALARGPRLPAALRASAFLHAAHAAFSRGQRDLSQSLVRSARQAQETALAVARAQGDERNIASAVLVLAEVAQEMNEFDTAWTYAAEARQHMEGSGDQVGLIRALEVMAHAAAWRGDGKARWPLMEELMVLCRELDDSERLIHALGAMGHLARDEGDYVRARSLYTESLALRRKLGYQIALAQSLEDLAVLAGREQQHRVPAKRVMGARRAIRLLGAGESFCETLGAQPPVAMVAEYERTVAEGRAALGEEGFAAAWAEGRAMSLDQALEYALEGSPGHAPAG